MRAYSVRIAALALLFAVSALLPGFRPAAEADLGSAGYQLLLDGEPEAAAQLFRRLVAHNPASPFHWATLAETLADAGDSAGADAAMRQAVECGPALPQIRIRAAHLSSAQGHPSDAARHLAVVLERTGAFDGIVFEEFRRLQLRPAEILPVLPATPRVARAYFEDVRSRGVPGDLTTIWNWMLARDFTDGALAHGYFESLVAAARFGPARQDWIRYLEASKQPGYEGSNRVYNPRFEHPPTGSPFDWRFDPVRGVALKQVPGLELVFAGEANIDFHHVSQRVAVTPGSYTFEATLRTANLTTNHGVGFRIYDVQDPRRLDLWSDQFTGTQERTQVTLNVGVPPSTGLLGIAIVRTPTEKFDNKIAGTAWVESVSLTPATAH